VNPLPPGEGRFLGGHFLNVRFLRNKSENFLLTLVTPSPFPSPQWGEGKGEGKFQISLVRDKFSDLNM
jgi:hypothetical protein